MKIVRVEPLVDSWIGEELAQETFLKAYQAISARARQFAEYMFSPESVAAAKGEFIVPPKKFKLGDTDNAFKNCEHIFEGRTEQNGQEHLYIETQGAYAMPTENGGIRVYSSTQGPTAVQRAVCRVTGLQMHQVEVDVVESGGPQHFKVPENLGGLM